MHIVDLSMGEAWTLGRERYKYVEIAEHKHVCEACRSAARQVNTKCYN